MKTNSILARYLFIVIFLVLLLLPIVFFNKKDAISTNEKRNLAQFPDMFKDGKLNTNVSKEIELYISDRFGFRQKLVELDNNLKYKICGDIGNDIAVLGKNNWLYYVYRAGGDNLGDYLKLNLVNTDQAAKFAEMIENRQLWCKRHGIEFIFLIAPNKHTIYPEYFVFERPMGITRTEQFTKAMEDKKLNYLYPRDELIKMKAEYNIPLYYETDTHWNQLGAYIAFQELYNMINSKLSTTIIPDISYTYEVDVETGGGDITNMMGFSNYGKITNINFTPERKTWNDYYRYIKNERTNGVITENVKMNLPRAIIFRDSFFNTLEPFTSCIFSSAEYKWKFFEEEDKKDVLRNKPDIVIWEIVERSTHLVPELYFDHITD